jgi:ubiquinone/menaquinone biosynthesis C-methylase UbiE
MSNYNDHTDNHHTDNHHTHNNTHSHHTHSHHTHNHQIMGDQNFINKIDFLDGDMRKKTLPPEEILNLLPIQKKSYILDVGAGSGYLTIPAAKRTDGTVYALDIDPRMLNVISSKAKSEDITNIQLIQGGLDPIPMEDNSVDVVLASLILHEVGPLAPVLKQVKRLLKVGGYFLCLEYEKEESTAQGPPMHIRISSAEMEKELISAGLIVEQNRECNEAIYIITARK